MIDLIKWFRKKNEKPEMKSKVAKFTIYNVAQTSYWVVILSSFLTGLAYLIESPLDFASPIFIGIKLGFGMPAIRAWGIAMLVLSIACMVDTLFFKKNYWLIFVMGGVRTGLGVSSLLGALEYGSQHVGYTSSISSITIGIWLIIIGCALIVGKPTGIEYTVPPLTPKDINENYDTR